MFGYLKDEKTSHLLFIALWLVYMIVCLSKNTYAAAIASIVDEGLFTKSAAGVISAAFYLIYGIAQLCFSRLTDKFRPWRMLHFGLCAAILCNFIMAISRNYVTMLITWSLNGLLQFAVWPSTLKIIATVIMKEHRQKAAMYISFCLAAGSFFSYFSAMFLLKYFAWPSLFWLSTGLLVAVFLFWLYATMKAERKLVCDDLPKENETEKEEGTKAPLLRLLFSSGLAIILFAVIGRCMLDNGVKSWVPTMMMDSYGISASTSSFIALLVTLINIAGVFLATYVQRKMKNNALLASMFFFGITIPQFFLLLMTGKMPIALVTILLITSTTSMYAINQLTIVELPTAFRKYNCIGTVTSIINGFASFGVTLGSFGYGFLAEHFGGWNSVFIAWIIISVLSTVFCLLALPLWRKFTQD